MKTCPRCHVQKTIEDFSKSKGSPDGHYGYCRTCAAEKTKAWREANPEAQKKWETENADKRRDQRRNKRSDPLNRHVLTLREKHGINKSDYDGMFEKQGGKCAICGSIQDTVLQVDHDHVTGKIRGLLCGPCNRAIGLMQDNPDRIERAVVYLRETNHD